MKTDIELLDLKRVVEAALEHSGVNIHGSGMFIDGSSADITFDCGENNYRVEIKPI